MQLPRHIWGAGPGRFVVHEEMRLEWSGPRLQGWDTLGSYWGCGREEDGLEAVLHEG